jgi:hypothetical protein
MNYFKSLSQNDLCQIISETKNRLFLCIPSLHKDMVLSIIDLADTIGKENIHILIDFDGNTLRQGYGDFESLEILIKEGYDIKKLQDNRISFILNGAAEYYLFIESRSLVPAEKATINAIEVDPVGVVRLKSNFFGSSGDYEDDLTNAIILESKRLKDGKKLLSETQLRTFVVDNALLSEVKEDIKLNPVINPDFKRTVDFYSARFQYAELHFGGAKFNTQKVSIPAKALPFKNSELQSKLDTKLRLFDEIEQSDEYREFQDLSKKLTEIREEFLTPLSSRKGKRLLVKARKKDFQSEIKIFKEELEAMSKLLYETLLKEIERSKSELLSTLVSFYIANPTDKMKDMGEANHSMVAEWDAKSIVEKVKFPDAYKLIKDMKVECFYSDITVEDLSDEVLLNELCERGVINRNDESALADWGRGIDIR